MRITYLHQHFRAPDSTGGTRSYEFARRFVDMGHTVELITADSDPAGTATGAWSNRTIDGIHVHMLGVPYSNRMSFADRISSFRQFAFGSATRAAGIDADVIFATSTPLTIIIPAAFASWKMKVPVVFEVRDLWPEIPIAMGALQNPVLRFTARQLERFAYRMSAHIVALSPGMADGVNQVTGGTKPVSVIPNSADVSRFSSATPDREWMSRHFGVPPDKKVVLYGGTIGLANAVSYLVTLAKQVQDLDDSVVILVVGDGAEKEKVIELAGSSGVLDRAIFFGEPLAKDEMPKLLASVDMACSVFLDIPELTHNSANKFFDALAAAKPVAINYGGWQSELLRESNAGIVLSANDHHHAASSIVEKINDADWMRNASKAAYSLAVDRFNRDDHARDLIGILEKVAASA